MSRSIFLLFLPFPCSAPSLSSLWSRFRHLFASLFLLCPPLSCRCPELIANPLQYLFRMNLTSVIILGSILRSFFITFGTFFGHFWHHFGPLWTSMALVCTMCVHMCPRVSHMYTHGTIFGTPFGTPLETHGHSKWPRTGPKPLTRWLQRGLPKRTRKNIDFGASRTCDFERQYSSLGIFEVAKKSTILNLFLDLFWHPSAPLCSTRGPREAPKRARKGIQKRAPFLDPFFDTEVDPKMGVIF